MDGRAGGEVGTRRDGETVPRRGRTDEDLCPAVSGPLSLFSGCFLPRFVRLDCFVRPTPRRFRGGWRLPARPFQPKQPARPLWWKWNRVLAPSVARRRPGIIKNGSGCQAGPAGRFVPRATRLEESANGAAGPVCRACGWRCERGLHADRLLASSIKQLVDPLSTLIAWEISSLFGLLLVLCLNCDGYFG